MIGVFELMYFCNISAGKMHIEHLTDGDGGDDESCRIQMNRMDIYDAKILTL